MTTKNETLNCDLTVFTPDERNAHFDEAGQLRDALQGLADVGDSTEFYFSAHIDSELLRSFASNERRCCSWIKSFDVREEPNRKVLVLHASEQGRAAWTSGFMGIVRAPEELQRKGPTWREMIAISAGLCLACLLPIIGGMLVARGLMPANWNIGEWVYLGTGGALLGLYFVRRWWKKRGTTKNGTEVDHCKC